LILRHQRISKNENLIQNNSFCEKIAFFGVDSKIKLIKFKPNIHLGKWNYRF